ncbi:MAG: STAS domain-containing protein [Opitutae bacterium]|mgnify:FL=1|jgi:anti-sigma B factor antagonist|nr:STAS domain-containing protein [Opitutae bacterium]MBT5378762.1 STAS domain-containing protein [Opitutae bacterium]MBT6461429.1 STAS domain-containing protein [Opitutae bacterium]MBT6959059.1 STAS domain-containing protein [Opitutae bacterium]
MAVDSQPIFQVDPFSDPVVVRICGRASFQNSAPLSTFFQEMAVEGPPRFIIDFEKCTGMDSTFLGIIAGAALEARKTPDGYLALMRLGARNLELVRNLGLHRLAKVDTGNFEQQLEDTDATQPLEGSSSVTRQVLIEAHENLAGINEENLEKFQDIVEYLKSRPRDGTDQ